ncbi:MAG: diguanylate cyclase [Desulfovibrio sp.]|nr:diguanylate cyclase [Desulfovibrio sp.]
MSQITSAYNYVYNSNSCLSLQIIQILADIIDAKDRYSKGHSTRVAEYAHEIAKRYGYTDEKLSKIYTTSLLHDLGKIGIPDSIINKKNKLSSEEFKLVKSHTIIGSHILGKIKVVSDFATVARYHHERFDGTGYPDGLKGTNIPEIARIISVADAYDAMTSNRSYRDALPQKYVRFEIANGKGKQFDPVFAEIMLQMIDEDKTFRMREMLEKPFADFESMDFSMSFLMSACPELALSLKVSEREVEGSNIPFSVLVDFGKCMPSGFFVYKARGKEELLYANDIVFKIFGCQNIDEFKGLTGYTFPGMVYEQDLERIELSIIEQIESNEYNLDYVEYRIRRKDGKIRWIDDCGRLVNTVEHGSVFYVLIHDTTEQHISRETLTNVDHLTNVFNRKHFDVNIHKDIADIVNHGGRLCMVMIDIDKFKDFNDLYGHLVGDKCLAQVAQAMQNALRRKSDMLFRYGGEEFALLLPGTLLEDAAKLAERLRLAVRKLEIPHEHGPCGIVTVSAGVGMLTSEDASSFENPHVELIKLADQALYKAKDLGRDTVQTQSV